jgi:hypothetical protein
MNTINEIKKEPKITIQTKVKEKKTNQVIRTNEKPIGGMFLKLITLTAISIVLAIVGSTFLNGSNDSKIINDINIVERIKQANSYYEYAYAGYSEEYHNSKYSDLEKIEDLINNGYLNRDTYKLFKDIDDNVSIKKNLLITYRFTSTNNFCKNINYKEPVLLENTTNEKYLLDLYEKNTKNNCFKTNVKNEFIYITK